MIHFGKQNGPFCDVKRPILKITMIFLLDLYGFFTILEVVGLLELKIQKGLFFGKESGQSGVCQAPLRFLPIRRLLPSRLSAVQSAEGRWLSGQRAAAFPGCPLCQEQADGGPYLRMMAVHPPPDES